VLNKLSEKFGQTPGEYFIWSVQSRPVSVHLNLANVAPLNAVAGAGLGTLPRRGLEVGGLLLGRVHNPNDGQYIVSIEKIEPLEIEHVRGPSYILSSGDREELFRRVRKYEKKSNPALSVVGLYRSHTRPGLYLDEYDYDLMRSYFAHPSSVALLIRPGHDGPTRAGFFFWEDGEIHRARTYREFPLDASLLRSQIVEVRPDASAPVNSPLPEPEPPRIPCPVIPIAPPAHGSAAAAAPEPARVPVPAESQPVFESNVEAPAAVSENPSPQPAAWPRRQYFAWTAAAAAALIVAAILWRPFAASESSRTYNVLGLNAEPTQSGLRLTWNRSNPLVRRHSSAKLVITDGASERNIDLDAAQLTSGSILYWPTSQDVNFRLQIGDFAESLRAIAPKLPAQPAGGESQMNTAVRQTGTADPPPVEAAPAQQTLVRRQTRSRPREIRPAVLPGDPVRPSVRSSELLPPPAAELASVPVRLDAPIVTERAIARPPANAAEVEQVRGSGFKRAVSAIFGKQNDEGKFVPARAVRQVPPSLPKSVKLPADTRVSVKVSLDETGRVKGTDLVSRNVDFRLANAAMEAAKRWRFEPARQQDKKVSSSVILHFRFNREQGG
jgi:TonB family protein